VHVDQLRAALLASPQEFRPEWIAQGNKVVVPFAPPLEMPEEFATRLCDGFRMDGHTVAWGFSAWHSAFLPFDMVLAATDGSRAVLFGQDEFGLVAGPQRFVEVVLAQSISHACRSFATYAEEMKNAAQHLPEVARRYGCA
jgi:hypothetical protein